MSHDVFVSYSSKDKTIADAIVAALENNQIRCWYAPRDIKTSEDWGSAITSAIEESKVFLVIFSNHSNRSHHVLNELNLAVNSENIILPFRVENLEPKGAMKLHLSSVHWLNAYDPSWESYIKKLIKDVSVNLKNAIDDEKILVPKGLVNQSKKRKTLIRILTGIAICAFAILSGWYGWSLVNRQDRETEVGREFDTPTIIEDIEDQMIVVPETSSAAEEEKTSVIYDSVYIEEVCNSDDYGCAKIEPGQTIKIGMGLPLTGEHDFWGIDAKQSGLLAIADAGDLNGFRFELITKDDWSPAEGGAFVAKEFIADPTIVAIAGHAFSPSTAAALPFYQEHGLPILNYSATNPEFLEIGSTVFNHLSFTDKAEGFAASEYIFNKIGARNIAILQNSVFGEDQADFAKTGFEALGGNVIAFGDISENPEMWQDIINKQPELIYYCGLEVEASIIDLMNSEKLQGAAFFGCSSVYEYFINQESEIANVFYFTRFGEPKPSKEKDIFDTNYITVYSISPGVLTPCSWYSYDSTMILISKVREVSLFGEDGNLYVPRGVLIEAVRDLENYIGISGTYTCNNMGECNIEGPQIVQVIDGEYIPVE